MKPEKLFKKALRNPANFKYTDFRSLIRAFGFVHGRSKGGHHMFAQREKKLFLNVQEVKGEVKPYQVRQFLAMVEQHRLEIKG